MWGQVRNSNNDVILWHLLTRMHGCYDFKNSSHDLWQQLVNFFNCCAKLCYSLDKNLISLKNHLCLTLVNKPLCVMFHVSFIVDNLPYVLKKNLIRSLPSLQTQQLIFFLHWHTILECSPFKEFAVMLGCNKCAMWQRHLTLTKVTGIDLCSALPAAYFYFTCKLFCPVVVTYISRWYYMYIYVSRWYTDDI